MSDLIYTEENNVVTLTINRPKVKNAFNAALIAELKAACINAKKSNARLLILTAKGDCFCAGGDLNWMQQMAEISPAENIADALALAELLQILSNLPMPTLAAVNGNAFGGGVGLVAACDLAIALDTAKFCLSEVKLGLIPATIAPYLIRAIGERQAMRLMLTAEIIPANIAATLGLIHTSYSSEEFTKAITTLTKQILANGPNALRLVKTKLNATALGQHQDLATATAELLATTRTESEAKIGINAFLTKTKANWQ